MPPANIEEPTVEQKLEVLRSEIGHVSERVWRTQSDIEARIRHILFTAAIAVYAVLIGWVLGRAGARK